MLKKTSPDLTQEDNLLPAKRSRLTPYEITHLIRFGKPDLELASQSEKPVEYQTGKVEFFTHVFDVSSAVLIPRVETEALVEEILQHCQSLKKQTQIRIADIGTGSGAIGISLSLALKKLKINHRMIASDVSLQALRVAKKNAAQLGIKKNEVEFIQSNIFDQFSEESIFDILVANLPYIPNYRLSSLASSVIDFEPIIALDGGEDGFDLINKFLQQAPKFLTKKGAIFLEADYTHTNEQLLKSAPWKITKLRKDQPGVSLFKLML